MERRSSPEIRRFIVCHQVEIDGLLPAGALTIDDLFKLFVNECNEDGLRFCNIERFTAKAVRGFGDLLDSASKLNRVPFSDCESGIDIDVEYIGPEIVEEVIGMKDLESFYIGMKISDQVACEMGLNEDMFSRIKRVLDICRK